MTAVRMLLKSCATPPASWPTDRKSTRLNSSHANISHDVFCLKKENVIHLRTIRRSDDRQQGVICEIAVQDEDEARNVTVQAWVGRQPLHPAAPPRGVDDGDAV